VEVHCWTKHLNVSKEKLQKAIEKVGNSTAAVRNEFGGVIEGVGEAPTLLICKPLPHRNISVQHPFLPTIGTNVPRDYCRANRGGLHAIDRATRCLHCGKRMVPAPATVDAPN
jgi:Protein of unknown function (DUF3606)